MSYSNQQKFLSLSLRKRKYAKTKTALLNALLEELLNKPLVDISIKGLCQIADVSAPTFFNYFDSKQHMLVYFIQLWSIEMNALAKKCIAESNSHTNTIKHIFIETAVQISKHPRLMQEVIAFQALSKEHSPHHISQAEKWLFFDEIEAVEDLEGMGLESILPPLIHNAASAGELRPDCNEELLFLTLSALFMGTSLLLLSREPASLADALAAQLDFIFSTS